MTKRMIFKRIACALLATFALLLSSCVREETGEPVATDAVVEVVKIKIDAAKGEYIAARDVEISEVRKDSLPEGYLVKTVDAIGRMLDTDVKAGDILTEGMLAPKKETGSKEENVNTSEARDLGYLVITDYVRVNAGRDVSRDIQKVIDENPRRTIYFPDGEYLISNPICTSSNSETAVSLHLSNFAVIKAVNWLQPDLHMVRLGVIDKTFAIHNSGSNYYLYGGCIDGSGVAKGVSIEGGRETSIRNVSI
ncbi:MAG: flagella basal body P-ring formation protein FlgA, partial [Clostridia bacterium]|nr:flagella basal body P-ring formation protein FlgA [Clostridia bacterium]